ncbi:MAG: exo-alpha-sialidase [Planctomycetaceae bacterium]|nr:exo-alpha-sialidase [Planctomycetales bacterium]MCB9927459.1 exo-alpha-sialidase [Planctomycetaceae bacterium]
MKFAVSFTFTIAVLLSCPLVAQDPLAAIVRPSDPLTPQEQLSKFHLPAGFEIQLVAAEPEIQKPMNLAFDGHGRLWVTGSVEYPFAAKPGEGRDTIRVLQNINSDGHAGKINIFADGLNIPIGLYPYRSGVVAYSIPNIWYLQDTDGDGKCDHRQVLYGPLGDPVDTHGMQNAFRRGADGWLYICHGFRNESTIRGTDGSEIKLQSGNTYRIRLDGSRVEQFSWGQVNPFGSTFLPTGDLITADCHSKPLTMLLRGGYFSSFGKPHDGLGYVPSIMEHGHGSTAIAGAAYFDGDDFPEPYRGSLFVGNVMTSRIHRDSLVWHGSSLEAHEEEDFLTCDDPWFRPVDLQIGPDGALYIADFYNRIIGHYEVPLDHTGRDRTRGRIWRVVYTGGNQQPATSHRDLAEASPSELIDALASSAMQVRALAIDELSDRVGEQGAPLLQAAARSSSEPNARIAAMWTLHRLGHLDSPVIVEAAKDDAPLVRVHAMRLISEAKAWSSVLASSAIAGLHDESPLVRRAAADALSQHTDSSAVAPLLAALKVTPSEDVHLRHALMIALKSQLRDPSAFAGLSNSKLTREQRAALAPIALAISTPAAAEFLLAVMSDGLTDAEQLRPQLIHVASHAAEASVDRVVELVRDRAGDDIDFQTDLIQTIQQQLVQRGISHRPSVDNWGRELAERVLLETEHNGATWTTTTGPELWGLDLRNCEDGQKNVTFLSSLPGGERAVGAIRSSSFELPAKLSFFLCGHLGFPKDDADERNLVRLRLDDRDEIVRNALPPRNDTAVKVDWDLTEFAGRRGYVEVVDGLNTQAYAWLAVSRFEPPVIAIPATAPNVLSKRQIAAATIARTLRLEHLAPRLSKLAGSNAASIEARAACVETLLAFAPRPIDRALLAPLKDEAVARSLRDEIALKLSQPQDAQITDLLTRVLQSVPARLQSRIAEDLVASREGGEALLKLTSDGVVSPRLLQRPEIRRSLETTNIPELDARLAKLTTGLPPLNEQVAQLIADRIKGFAQANKSTSRGQEIFAKHCIACHQVAGKGAIVGPQLDGVGNRGLERVAEDFLDPNRNIDAAFHVSVLSTTDGRVLSGLLRRQEGKAKVYVGKDGKEFRVLADEIEEEILSRTSIMPDNFGSLLSEPECHDLLAFLTSLRTPAKAPATFTTVVFQSGQDGYHTYRIPAIVTTAEGDLIAMCEGRKTSRADHGDVDLVFKRSRDGGQTWGPISLLYEQGGDAPITIGNPCPVLDRTTNTIWLPFTRDNDDVLLTSSRDGGHTWSQPKVITASVKLDDWTWYATGPGIGIQIERGAFSGRLVIPCDHRVKDIPDRKRSSRSHVIYSDDHGETWQIGGVTDFEMNECAVAELADGRLMLNMRSNRGKSQRGVALSDDGGISWSECRNDSTLMEPVCQASLLRYSWGEGGDNSRLLFSNPASPVSRDHMTLRVSYDDGKTWPVTHQVYEGSSSYSCLTRLQTGSIGLLYEREDYREIVYTGINLSAIESPVSDPESPGSERR